MVQENTTRPTPAYYSAAHINLDDFAALCAQQTQLADYPLASGVEQNILVYEGDTFRNAVGDASAETTLRDELCRALRDGPGVLIVKRAYDDLSVIDRTTAVFREIVEAEKAAKDGKGDHFGNNERIWNAIQKACVKDPNAFIDYYGNPVMATASAAWLGPNYRITAQMNNVKPGNKAQSVHRDYHLGFQASEVVAQYPAHMQIASQYLTLQGAVAHVDMPLETGPTLLLPYSHQYEPGYIAYTMPAFNAYFREHHSQVPFEKGDMVYFSPALFHGAGENVSDGDRLANLIQVSSAFGRTMETVNNRVMIDVVYPALLARIEAETVTNSVVQNTISAVADGYSFPTNLDSDPPIGGNAPATQADITRRAVAERWPLAQLQSTLDAYAARREA